MPFVFAEVNQAHMENDADYIAVIFDAGRSSFRNRLYSDYKAHRPDPPPELIPQFALIREATQAFGLPAIELADYEADDLIATYATLAKAANAEVTIVSSDKDLMQLVQPGVWMMELMKNRKSELRLFSKNLVFPRIK